MKGSAAERVNPLSEPGPGPVEVLRTLVPDIVDGVPGQLLWMLDTDNLRLSFRAADGTWVDLSDSGAGGGELTGWLGGSDGWVARFSHQPFNDQVDEG